MADGGGDGGSDVSYESVASEGGYEQASDRGRDPLPRIISASNCVEVFQRIRWDEGFNCRPLSLDEKVKLAKARGQLLPYNPLDDLPRNIMRFDGAIEAWLEELPPAENPASIGKQYQVLNEAAEWRNLPILNSGNQHAVIWYFTIEFLQQLWPNLVRDDDEGRRYWEEALIQRGCNIQSTHVEVGRVDCPQHRDEKARKKWLKALFAAMQTSSWSPNREARSLMMKRRLTHAAMSIGDAIQIGCDLWFVSLTGFILLEKGEALLPPGAERINNHGGDPEPSASAGQGKKNKNKKQKGGKGKGENEEGHEENGNADEEYEGEMPPSGKGAGQKRKKRKGKNNENAGQDDPNSSNAQAAESGQADGEWSTGKGGKGGKGSKGKGGKGKGKGKGKAEEASSKGGKGGKWSDQSWKGGGDSWKGSGDSWKGSGDSWKGKGGGYNGDYDSRGGGPAMNRAALRNQFQAERDRYNYKGWS